MHELSAAKNVIEIIRDSVPPAELASVRVVRMRVGTIAGIVPESLEFCYRVLTERTRLAASRLACERIPFSVHCLKCDSIFENAQGSVICPRCRSTDTAVVSGTELELATIELE